MTTYERIALLLSTAILLAGVKADIVCPAVHWFARSGAMVTVVAIVFASLDIRERLKAVPGIFDNQLKKSRDFLRQLGRTNGLDNEECDEFENKFAVESRKDVQGGVNKASKRVFRVELILFIVGTIIWGFGDLATDWFATL
jgi:hypothetical protein